MTKVPSREKFDEVRDKPVPETIGAGKIDPPSSWLAEFYQDEFKSFPKAVRLYIKYGAIVVATVIALSHTSRHIQSILCQWSPETEFCTCPNED